jgi:hypothetical protein
MEWNIYKWVPHKQMSKCQGSKTILAIFGTFYLLSLSCHCYFIFVIPFTILGLAIDHTFVGMHVGMNWKIIMETTPNPSSENV